MEKKNIDYDVIVDIISRNIVDWFGNEEGENDGVIYQIADEIEELIG